MLLCALSGSASVAHAVELEYNVPYLSPGSPFGVLNLDLYKPNQLDPERKDTTIVLLYGGSYNSGRKEDLAAYGFALADLGYTVIVPNYTLTTPEMPSFPQAVKDTLNAVYWARTTGATMHDVPMRLVLGGFSAGSTIAMTAAFAAPQFTTFAPPDQRGYIIDGAIGVSGRYDMVWNASIGIPATVSAYVGGPVYEPGWITQYSSASAITYINACSPPTVLIHGSHDPLVPSGNAVRMAQALTAAAVPNELNIVTSFVHDPAAVLGNTVGAQVQRIDTAVVFVLQNAQSPCGRAGLPPPPPPSGSCCSPSGACEVMAQAGCAGQWLIGGACVPNICAQPGIVGACCIGATCAMLAPENCIGPRSRFTGSGVECETAQGFACCRADFNQDGTIAVADVFEFLNLWFIAEPTTAIGSNGQSVPVVGDIFQYLNEWFSGCR